jgi:hypothetical protein
MRKSATLLAGIATIAALGCSTGATDETFSATLNRGAETAAGVTGLSDADNSAAATGSMSLTSNGVGVATYKLTVNNLLNITQAHIHSRSDGTSTAAKTGEPISVWLFDGPATGAAANFTGVLGCNAGVSCTSSFNQVQITAGAGTGAANTFDALVSNIRNHVAYVNVHTAANPGGAIRGQF